jgi:FkbM family methyltransferase
MGFVSYAQNFEDVMLWRALGSVGGGFYVDVGAAWPDDHSVTTALYERGWHGVNIEPIPRYHGQLQERRPRDQNLLLAVGAAEGGLLLHVFEETGLSTLDDSVAEMHRRAGCNESRLEVEVTTLATVWRRYVPAGQEVHFLKVDVEGLEGDVLRSNDWRANRPWIVVVEATLPMSPVECHESWEPDLLAAGYRFAYADGLNRFYVSRERADDLLPAFRYPPNVFDDFIVAGQYRAEMRIAQAEGRVKSAEERAVAADRRAAQAEARLAVFEKSISWRIYRRLRNRLFRRSASPSSCR